MQKMNKLCVWVCGCEFVCMCMTVSTVLKIYSWDAGVRMQMLN